MKIRSLPQLRMLFFVLMLGAAVLTACNALPGKPTIVIASPPSGSQYHEGDDVAVQSTSADTSGVVRVELDIDGAVVRNDTPPSAQTNFSIIQTWKATQGTHTITVRAYNAAGTASDPAAISIQVNASLASNNPSPTATGASSAPPPTPTNTPVSAPPSGPSPTTGAPPPAPTCTDNATFVTDVSVPDGTVFAAGTTFLKTWRLSNNGTCAWGVGYQFVFVSGEAMTGSTVVAVPATNPGATADISVSMSAPSTPGNHAGAWRMRSATGAVFGQSVSVKISVPGAPPPAPSGCTGTPNIASFTASSPTITAGSSTTLNWGAVTNADSVEIDNGIGGVPAPSSTSVSPGSTTTYTMTAHCGSNTTTRQVTVTVVPPLPPPVMVVYDFVAHADSAGWRNNDGTNLSFPGSTGNNTGFALWVNSPSSKMEDGSTPGRCLETHPKWVTGGTIYGTFNNLPPSYVVQASDRFHATFGFLNGAYSGPGTADVTFKVTMRHPTPPNDTQSFHKTYTGGLGSIDWSLAPWAGQIADFVLEVDANNANAGRDWACWVTALISR